MNKRIKIVFFVSIALFFLVLVLPIKQVLYTISYPVYRSFHQTRIVSNISGYLSREAEDFVIRYTIGDEDIVDMVERAAQEHYIEICRFFDYVPDDRIEIIVYPSEVEMYDNLNMPSGQRAIGAYHGGTVNIISPKLWIEGSYDNIKETFLTQGPVVHEVTHYIVDDMAKGNFPMWFTEGISLYMDYSLLGFEWAPDLGYVKDPIPMDELTRYFDRHDEVLAYRQSFLIVKGMVENYGRVQLLDLLKELGNGTDFNSAIRKVLGIEVYMLNDLAQAPEELTEN